jgi:hypothetical protein
MYAVYTKDLDAIILGDMDLGFKGYSKWMEEHKKYILNKDSYMYGCVLVSTKRVKCGGNIKFGFDTSYCTKKPQFPSRYSYSIHWLWFHAWFNFEYRYAVDKILIDYLKEHSK